MSDPFGKGVGTVDKGLLNFRAPGKRRCETKGGHGGNTTWFLLGWTVLSVTDSLK